ncbi:AbrB/MazE/SpoVT family DNA-binding domain-containing protein [Methanobrevibacter boviskoreani]|uniref:AbrB/MazE/SpoVT family DNA-binding domain-containing protein n=1 Tax=Methanobrevibacter boviskoreani TaxID=1348249 RepID=UPI0023A7A971|nr:AbrB/MazE/SpoVT family DNA-binding domain-containing protein [Methanobrevibacter boviskoreani]MCI6774843.1 AbrB/MazE/SpoVT family DNA-binding domain-containing protein [Methanobrevibacter boviskoreani]
MFEYETKVSIARPNSKSGRTTIPKEVMNFLDLKIGDYLSWNVKINGEQVIVEVNKKEE